MKQQRFEELVAEYNKKFDVTESEYYNFSNELKRLDPYDMDFIEIEEHEDFIDLLVYDSKIVAKNVIDIDNDKSITEYEQVIKMPWGDYYFITIASTCNSNQLSKIYKVEPEEIKTNLFVVDDEIKVVQNRNLEDIK